jgi:hypothetical protein
MQCGPRHCGGIASGGKEMRLVTPKIHYRNMGNGGVVMQEEQRQYAYLEGPCKVQQVGHNNHVVRIYNGGGELLLLRDEFLEMLQAERDRQEFEAYYFSDIR